MGRRKHDPLAYLDTADGFHDHYERETLTAEADGRMPASEARELLVTIAEQRERDRETGWPRSPWWAR